MRKLIFPCLLVSAALLAVAISGIAGMSGEPSGITILHLKTFGRSWTLGVALLLAVSALVAWKGSSSAFWKTARIVNVLGTASIGLLPSMPLVDWRLSVIFGLSGSVALFIWLSMMRYRTGIDWSAPYDWSAPFFPTTTYPLRSWIVNSYSALIGGAVGGPIVLMSDATGAPLSPLLLTTGAFLLLTIRVWSWLFLNERGQVRLG